MRRDSKPAASDWDRWHAIELTPVDDVIAELTETVDLEFTATSEDPEADRQVSLVSARVVDNDLAEVIASTYRYQNWSFDTAKVDVVLASQPQMEVLVEASLLNPKASALPSGLVFTPQNWDQPQSIHLGIPNGTYVDYETVGVALQTSTSDPRYQAAPEAHLTLGFFDDDFFSGVDNFRIENPFVIEGGPAVMAIGELDSGYSHHEHVWDLRSSDPSRLVVTHRGAVSVLQTVDDNVVQPQTTVAIHPRITFLTLVESFYAYPIHSGRWVIVVDDDSRTVARTLDRLELNERRAARACTQLVLSIAPTAPVQIPLTSSDPSAFLPEVAEVAFDVNDWFEPHRVCVRATDDTLADGTQTATLELGPAVSADPDYDGFDAVDITVAVTDDETPGFTVYRDVPLVVVEGGGGYSRAWVLSTTGPAAPVDLTWRNPLQLSAFQLEGGVWRVYLPSTSDELPSPPRTDVWVGEDVVSADPDYNSLTAPDLSATVLDPDNDIAIVTGELQMSISSVGPVKNFTVVLREQPNADVVVPVAIVEPGAVQVTPATLTFTPNDWDTPQQVTLTWTNFTPGVSYRYNMIDLGPQNRRIRRSTASLGGRFR